MITVDSNASAKTPSVILVEDDTMVRMVISEAFDDAGFIVFEAANADEAVALLEVVAPRIAALITDVNMPGVMDGLKLACHTRERWPWIDLVVTSGNASPEAGRVPADTRFFAKPYIPRTVVGHVQERTRGH